MPYPIRHKLLTAGGTLYSNNEIWSMSMRIIPDVSAEDVTQAQVDSLATATQTMFTSVTLAILPLHSLTYIKLAPIGTDGLYPPGEIAYEHVFTGVFGGAPDTTVTWPGQDSICVSLRTAAPRGRGHAGRFYLPPTKDLLGTDGRLSSGRPAAINGVMRTWLLAINAATDVGTVGVLGKVGSGSSRVVTAVRTGRVVDTIRRRRSALSEDYVDLAL